MSMDITLSGNIDEIIDDMHAFLDKLSSGPKNDEMVFTAMPLQDLLAHVGKRLEEEDYEFTATKRIKPQAERKREDARAKLRGELEASLVELDPTETEQAIKAEDRAAGNVVVGNLPDMTPVTKPKTAKAKTTTNGSGDLGDPAKIKANCLVKLKELYNSGRKIEVNKILAAYGGGAKNFSSVPDENFIEIMKQVEALG